MTDEQKENKDIAFNTIRNSYNKRGEFSDGYECDYLIDNDFLERLLKEVQPTSYENLKNSIYLSIQGYFDRKRSEAIDKVYDKKNWWMNTDKKCDKIDKKIDQEKEKMKRKFSKLFKKLEEQGIDHNKYGENEYKNKLTSLINQTNDLDTLDKIYNSLSSKDQQKMNDIFNERYKTLGGQIRNNAQPETQTNNNEPEQLVQDEPVQEQPVQDEPVQEQPVQDEPVQEQPVQPAQDEPVQEQPVQDEPVQEQPVQDEPVQEQPVQDEPVQEQPVQPAQEEPEDDYETGARIADYGDDENYGLDDEEEYIVSQTNSSPVSDNLTSGGVTGGGDTAGGGTGGANTTKTTEFNYAENENDFNKLMETFAKTHQNYYKDGKGKKGNAHTKEEIAEKNKINRAMKNAIQKRLQNLNQQDAGNQKTDEELMNIVKEEDIKAAAQNEQATMKLFQIQASGVYIDKEGNKKRLTQKQRAALAGTLVRISEQILNNENSREQGQAKAGTQVERTAEVSQMGDE